MQQMERSLGRLVDLLHGELEKEPEHWKQASKALAGSLLAPVTVVVDLQWRTLT